MRDILATILLGSFLGCAIVGAFLFGYSNANEKELDKGRLQGYEKAMRDFNITSCGEYRR